MFVLEKILRGLSEETEEKLKINSIYNELLNKVKELRVKYYKTAEYHERLKDLVWPYLNSSSHIISADYLKIFFFAHDNLILTNLNSIDWIGAIKNLLEEKEFPLIIRSLRYLKFQGENEILENIGLLLLNTLNKKLNENNLMKLLRSEKVNDRIKAMIIKVLILEDEDIDEVIRMLGDGIKSAVIKSVLKEKFKFDFNNNQKVSSSSKLINFLNGNYKSFSETEQTILEDRKLISEYCNSNNYDSYEQYIQCLYGKKQTLEDPNALRYLLKMNFITCEEFIEQKKLLESIDNELLAIKTCDPKIFWESLNNINLMTSIYSGDILEMKANMLENPKDNSESAQNYFSKLIKQKGTDNDSRNNK